MTQHKQGPEEGLPQHIAIIMDGNGRWATARGLSRSEGHKAGSRAVRTIVTRCRELGVTHLTLYAFSQENWGRPKTEIGFLFDLLVSFLRDELPAMERENIRLSVFGDISALPLTSRKALEHAMSRTANNSALHLNLALNYSGRADIVQACRKLAAADTKPEDITEQTISDNLWTAGHPDPDLVIRTSGEIRLSNFLLYQSAYSEFYFTDIQWPDFGSEELDAALATFRSRSRRFGRTEEQKGS
ncbi:isoprenyl transferase [Oleidesulfovibrio sp.]|uniref:isoprenyl transferase n=1 Tax=Oleidesulfovibrio sp. TaxID=2909707 RepID=UPI003A892418